MTLDYIILFFLFLLALTLVLLKIIRDERSNSSNNDGGLPFEWDVPELDLPPGVILPIDGPVRERDEVEEPSMA
uniref:Uncharacterized protein n=1 Tax=Roseihalotalea indica TaxID=2867963 RepID=A0AA49JIF1_9BACT|nr:hypothetical protein K4G66_20390 [Tunicatimonas sp. TK19036]